jgi:hypothetical protein
MTLLTFGRFDPEGALWLEMAAEPVLMVSTRWFSFLGMGTCTSRSPTSSISNCATVNRIRIHTRLMFYAVGSETPLVGVNVLPFPRPPFSGRVSRATRLRARIFGLFASNAALRSVEGNRH